MLRFISCFVQLRGETVKSKIHILTFQSLYITSAVQGSSDHFTLKKQHPHPSRSSGLVASPPLTRKDQLDIRFFFSCPLQLRNKRAGGVGKDGSFFSLLVKHLDKNLYQQILILAMISWGNGWWRLSPAIANNPTNY